MKRKIVVIVSAVLALGMAIACDAGGGKGGSPNPPPGNNNPQGDGPLVHPVTLQIRAYDCRDVDNPTFNPCPDEVLGYSGATVTVMAQAPNGTIVKVRNNRTGALVDTCGFIGDSTGVPCYTYQTDSLPWKEEYDIPDGLVYMVWKIRVDRTPPYMKVRCEIVPITSGTPIVQVAGGNEYYNEGPNGTTTGDITCGWPVGWALPPQFKG